MSEPVGFWARFGATLLDSLLFLFTGLILSMLFSESVSTNLNDTISEAYSLLLPVFWYGYTVGKRILGIRIVRTDGTNVGFWNMVRRNILAALVYFSPLILGFGLFFALLGWDKGELFLDDNAILMETDGEDVLYNVKTDESTYAEGGTAAFWAMTIGFLGSMGLILASALMVGIRTDKRSVHDFVAGTYVTRNPPGDLPPDDPEPDSLTNVIP